MLKWASATSCAILLTMLQTASAQTPPNFIRTHADIIAIEHVEVIDGTGGSPRLDQTVVLDHGRIAALGRSGRVRVPANAAHIDGRGKTLIPGMVGMHEHMFILAVIGDTPVAVEQFVQAPLLYLASGVTTARTTGSVDPYSDLAL
jgi:predicted amidohydrolase